MLNLKVFSITVFIIFSIANLTLSAQIIKDDFRVNDDTTGGISVRPDISILENGGEIIVWRDDRNGPGNIYGQLYDNTGNAIDSNFKVSTYSGTSTEYLSAISSFGDSLLVVWEYGYGQWLLSDGSQSGSAFSLASGNVSDPDVAVSDSGFFVVWDVFASGKGYDVFMKRFEFNGDSNGPRITMNDDAGSEYQRDPCIAINDNGSFVAVWQDERYGNVYGDIYGQRFDVSGNKIGSNFRVNDNDTLTSYQYEPSCAMNPAGDFLICWTDMRDGNANIYGQRFDSAGNPIDTNFLIIDGGGAGDQYNSSCAVDSAGNFVVVWNDYRDGPGNIYGQIYDSAGSAVGGNFRIDESISYINNIYPKVSIKDTNFVVTWQRSSAISSNSDIYKRRFLNDGTPVGNEVKVNDLDGAANQENPNIDMNTGGKAVVTWQDWREPDGVYFQQLDALGNMLGENMHIGRGYNPDVAVAEDSSFAIVNNYTNSIYYRRFNPAGDSIGPAFVISNTTSNSRYRPAIDIGSDKIAVAAWEDRRSGSDDDIYAQMIDSLGDTVGVNFRVNDDVGTAGQYVPDVAISSSGKFIIVWEDNRDGGNRHIYGQIFSSDGNPSGSNFRIDSGGPATQYYASAGALPNGNFIVAWQDYRLPSGIYAQIIDSTGILVDTNFRVSGNYTGNNPWVSVAPSGGFVITWQGYNYIEYDIYAQIYNPDFSPNSTIFKVNNETESLNTSQRHPGVATDGSSIIFVWEDAKWQRGFDIAAKVFEWTSGIEEVIVEEDGFKILEISSPILTGKEWLTINLDSPAKVDFQLINVAGIVVSSKKLDYTTPGIKKVDFDVSKLTSGPYFLSFKTDKGRTIKKTLVIR